MKKILTLFIALILVAGIVSVAKSGTIDTVFSGSATRYSKDRHIVQSSDGTIVVVYRVWETLTDVRAKKSIDNGANWGKLEDGTPGYTVLNGNSAIKDQNFSICIDADDNIYVTYAKYPSGAEDVFFKKLTAQAGPWTTWTVGTEETVDDTDDNHYPTITYQESTGRVWIAYSHDNGTTAWLRAKWAVSPFTDWTLTTVDSAGQYDLLYPPTIFIRDGNPYIVYNNDNNPYDLMYSALSGSSWSGGTIYDGVNPDPVYDFSVTLITNTVHVAWFYNGELYHTYSYNGTSWTTPEEVSSSDPGDGDLEDCEVSLTTDWDTDDVELWCFASIYYEDPGNQYEDWDIKYIKWNGSSWTSWDTVGVGDSTKERHATTPFISRGHVPLAYMYGRTDPYDVEFDFSITLDATSPGTINDLSGTCPTGDVILTWSTPGDDGGSGTLPEMSGYRLDYSSVTKSWDKNDYEVWIPTHGVTPGTGVSYTVPSLQEETDWYFRIWTRDEVPNWSGLSNGCTVWVSAPSQTYNWDGGGATGVWADADNWDVGGSYPDDATDRAVINTGSESISTPGTVLTIGELELGSDYSGILTLGGNFTLDDSGPWDADLTISNANATLDLAGYNLTLESGSTFSNNGTLRLQGGETLTSFTNDTNSGTVEYTGDGDAAVDTYTITNVTTNYYNLTINSTGTADDVFQLGAELAINGAGTLIVTSGVLYLNGNDITGASAVRGDIAGTIRLYGDESVFWTANDTDSGTYEYVGNGTSAGDYTIKAFTGTTDYYHLTINSTLGVTDTFRLPTSNLIVAGNFTLTAGTFNTNDDTTDRNLSVTGNVDIDGTFTANSSTITVSGNWNSVAGTFNRDTSTVQLTGTGTVSNVYATRFYDLVVAYSEETTTVSGVTLVDRKLTINGGNLSGGSIYFDYANDTNPLTITAGSTITTTLVFRANVSVAGTVNVPAYDRYAALHFTNYSGSGTGTYQAQGNITCTYMRTYSAQGGGTCIFDSNGYNLTINGDLRAGDITYNDRYGQYNFGTSTVNITGSVTIYPSAAGSTNSITFTSGSLTVGRNWTNNDTFTCGTSTVTFDTTGTSTLTGSCTFYVLVSTTTEKTVQVSSDTVIDVTNHLNFENITLQSTSPGATWYLNLSGTQDVHHVDVRDSNADDGNTIYAGCSTDLGNNTNWIFDDSILTWDGSESTNWNTAQNWNFNIVPLSTHTVIIPDGTPYDPQLTSNVIISSITIQTDGELSLSGYNISVSSDVYISGSLICAAGEQITVGGNWSASSGATFTAANSTTTFNGSGSFNILSSGTTFYNLAFSNSVSTWTLTDALSCTNISVVNGTLNDAGNTVTVNGNITFPTASDNVTSTGTWIQAADGNITGYVWGNKLGVYQINSGVTVTMLGHFAVKKLVMQANSTLSGSGKAIRTFPVANDFWDIDNTASVTLNALTDNEGAAFTQKGLSPATFNVNRINIEVSNTGTLTLTGNWNIPNTDIRALRINGICTLDTSSYDVTAKGLYVGYVASNYNGKLDLGSGTHDVEGLGLYPGGALASNEIDLDSCNISVSGNVDFTGVTVTPGTSTVTFYGTGDSTLTGSCTFYVLVSTTTNKTVEVSSDTVIGVTGHLNFENITLQSTSPGATWYLNLSGTQDVHHVDVEDSNASGGDTIYARSSTDLGNNTNWIFDDSILTWDGSESTNWNTAENWNFNIVPLSTHTVIIPDGTPYDPQLTSNVIISSITIQTDGELSLNEKNITVTSDVYIQGSLICSNTEQITVGGNWSAYSGATVTASSSTVTFNASSGTKNILSSGTTFYNLVITTTTTTATYELSDALYVQNDFTLLNGTFDTNDSGNYVVNVGSSVYINGGTFEAGASTITCGANWDSSGGTFNYDQSTVDLTGTGNLKTKGGSGTPYFYNLSVSTAGKTTTLLSHVGVADTLTIGNGALTDGASSYYVTLTKSGGAPLLIHGSATITLSRILYRPASGTVTVAGGDYGTLTYLELCPRGSGVTFDLGGNVTVNGTLWLVTNDAYPFVCNTQDKDLTVNCILFGASWATGDTTLNCGTSTIDIGTSGLDMANNGGSHAFNLNSATITCAGNWQLSDGTGSIDQNWGTSTVTFYGTGDSTLTGSTTFYVLVSTTTGKNVKFTSDIVIGVTNHLNFENITLRSTSSGATWYLNLSGDQDVSGVDVRDSNASGGNTIIDFDCPYIESCYYGNNTNWDFAPPAAITDLTGECDSDTGDVTLSWSTPGDDEWIGVLSSTSEYRIDYSTDSSRQWHKDTYEVSIPTYGVTPNTEVSRTITGLTGDSTWYFRIWTADEIPLWSDLSNGCTVWVNPILSVSISTDTYDFGDVPLGQSTHTVSIITVTNDGNLAEDFGLSCTTTTPGGSPWYPGLVGESSDYLDRFILRGVFNATEVATDDFGPEDTIEEDIRWSQSTSTFTVTGSYTGAGVETDGDRNIWFRLDLPTGSSTSHDQQITVTITAKEPD